MCGKPRRLVLKGKKSGVHGWKRELASAHLQRVRKGNRNRYIEKASIKSNKKD